MKIVRSYEVKIWVGLRQQYSEYITDLEKAKEICQNWANSVRQCVTITPTEFIYVDGNEPGFIVGFVNYPRFPMKRKQIRERAFDLAWTLKYELNQFRITITTPFKSYMIE